MRPSRAAARLLGLATFLGIAACATPEKSLVVLLPSPGAAPGAVSVRNAGGEQLLDHPWLATEVGRPSDAPTRPVPLDRASVDRIFGEALGALPPPPFRSLLYFENDSAELASESRTRLPAVLKAVADRQPASVSVVGHTDTVGSPERNHRLGLQRAQAAAEILRSLGATPAAWDVSSHGEAAPLVPTDDEVPEPRNRRVEVTVR